MICFSGPCVAVVCSRTHFRCTEADCRDCLVAFATPEELEIHWQEVHLQPLRPVARSRGRGGRMETHGLLHDARVSNSCPHLQSIWVAHLFCHGVYF